MQTVITGEIRVFSFENLRFLFLALAFCFVFQGAAQAQESVIWDQGYSYGAGGVADFGPSQKAGSTAYTLDMELADDINMVGTINRIDVRGYTNGFIQVTPSSSFYYGLNIRFYAFGADNKPGALQAEYFIPKGSPDFLYQDNGLGDLRVRLASPFQATGRHFLTVQAVLDPFASPGNGGATHKWYWRSTNAAEPIREESFYFRANPAAPWGRDEPNDGSRNLSMRLWGTRILTTPPVIAQISVDNLPQAGRLKITGSNFGSTQGTGMVRINGASAPVSAWTDTSITAYVSDASTIGVGSVEVITAGGTSNPKPFTVLARPAAIDRVKWRFQADDSYIQGRPAIGTDGTIYALGINGHLYALTPNGGLKWIFRGTSPAFQSVSIGADNTVYFAGFNIIYAVNPNGTLKWQLVNPSGGDFDAGPNVGPDGNIYAVASFVNQTSEELGAITISPAGQILNNRPGYTRGYGTAFQTREIVFGSNQYYFGGLNNALFSTYGLQFFALGGNYIRTVSAGDGQPAVAPDGTVYSILGANPGNPERVGAFSPTSGTLLRTILTTEIRLTPPDIGADGTIYAAHNLTTLSAYTPNGAKLWDFSPDGSLYGSAIVNPQNTVVTVSGYDYGEPGVIYGVSNTGQSLWTLNLTAENGGYIRTTSRARFTPDGETVYYGTDVNSYATDVYSYLYAISSNRVFFAKPFDFDGDGKTDISIFRPSAGEWWYLRSSDGQNRAFRFGTSSDKIVPADFTGDGKTDVAFFRPVSGEWFVLRSEDNSYYSFPFGISGDIPVVGDFDSDGKADAAVFRPSTATWYINKSTGGTTIQQFGASGDKPVASDYDGDGKTDIAIFRPSGANGAEWWIRKSSDGSVFVTQFGSNTDQIVQGDYTGDGKTDIAFWRPSNGFWYVLRSEDFSFYAFPFGTNGDVPISGDYDGDGKWDAGVFRPSDTNWYIQRSTSGTLIQQFGIAGDQPVPNAFVP